MTAGPRPAPGLLALPAGQTSAGTLAPSAQPAFKVAGTDPSRPPKFFDVGGTHKYTAGGFLTLTVTITAADGRTVTLNPLLAVDP